MVNLLIVEGEATMRARLRAYLEMILPRCQVLEAGNGPHALYLGACARPELVLVDAGLKDTSGFELTASLRALSPAPAVIVISYHAGEDCVVRARNAGAYACLVRDRLASDLAPTIARAIGVACASTSGSGSPARA